MRTFSAEWPNPEILQHEVAELPWYLQVILLDKLSDRDERLWYASAAIEGGWSRAVLVHQIESRARERSGKAINNFANTMPPDKSDLAQQAIRDPYLFDFVGNAGIGHERTIVRGLVEHVEKFLLELGQGFAFIGKQTRLEIGDQEFFVDLLFYHLAEWQAELTSTLPSDLAESLPTIDQLESELADATSLAPDDGDP